MADAGADRGVAEASAGSKSPATASPESVPLAVQSAEEIVEAVGFGQAQLRVLFLAHGIWFIESCQVCLQMVATHAMAADLDISSSLAASLSSLVFIGIGIGSALGGLFGDAWGRRPLLLLAYAIAFAAQLGSAVLSNYWALAILRLLMGIGQGLGMPPALAMVAESTPAARRKLMQGFRNYIFASGNILAYSLVMMDSPNLVGLHWRLLFVLGALPALVVGMLAFAFLPESPVFLTSAGRFDEAEQVLTNMRRLNGCPGVSVSLGAAAVGPTGAQGYGSVQAAGGSGQKDKPADNSLSRRFSLMFRGRHRWTTLTLSMGCFVSNLVLWGHQFAFPQVATHFKAPLPVAEEGLVQSGFGLIVCSIAVLVAHATTYRNLLLSGLIVGVVGPLAFVESASRAFRSPFEEWVFFFSQNAPGLCAALGVYACLQLSTDLYPASVASTSAAAVVLAGRVGAIAAPVVFSVCVRWQSFYCLMAILAAFTGVMAWLSLPESDVTLHPKTVDSTSCSEEC